MANTPPAEGELTDAPGTGGEVDNIRNRTTGSTRNYEISRTVASTQEEIGKITRVFAAIVIRAPATTAGADGGAADAPAMPETLIADLQRLTETAIGFDADRGDSVTILAQPFAHPEILTEAPGMNLDWVPSALREFALIALVAVVGLGVVRPLLMRQTQPAARGTGLAPYDSARGLQMDNLEGGAERRQKDLAISVLGNRATREEKQAVLRSLVADDPVRIATVMHRMMKSDLDSA